MHQRTRPGLLSFYFLVAAAPLLAGQEPPDLEFNPVTLCVESVDLEDASHRVRHVIDQGLGHTRTVTLVSSAAGERPRIAIEPDGDSWIVWSAGTVPNRLYYAKRTSQTATWSDVVALSATGDDSRNPEIVRHNGGIWMAYEIRNGAQHTVVTTGVTDIPEPIPTVVPIATMSYGGDLDIVLSSAPGHLWVTWIHSATHVGWSERNPATGLWSLPQYQAYGLLGVDVARALIATLLVGP